MSNSKTAREGEFASDSEKAGDTGGQQAGMLKGERAKRNGATTYTEDDLRKLGVTPKPAPKQ